MNDLILNAAILEHDQQRLLSKEQTKNVADNSNCIWLEQIVKNEQQNHQHMINF